jgi:hypothetical protein
MAMGPGFLIRLQGWYFPPTSDPALFGCTSSRMRSLGAGRLASRVFACVRFGLIVFLRTTTRSLPRPIAWRRTGGFDLLREIRTIGYLRVAPCWVDS